VLVTLQMYAPTTLAPPRDFCTLRYTTILEDGNLVICERSLAGSQEPIPSFVRAEMLPSGFLIRPCEGGGCIIHVVDHYDLEVPSA
jgi:homeobox-leucine zipper protein